MKIKVDGEISVEKAILSGMKFDEWTEVELEIVPEIGDGVRLTFSGYCKSVCCRQEMAEIHIEENGVISMRKPVIRPYHDHDDQTNYRELRGVSTSWGGSPNRAKTETETVSSEAATIVPSIVNY